MKWYQRRSQLEVKHAALEREATALLQTADRHAHRRCGVEIATAVMIPNPRTTVGALAVTDGHFTAGYVVKLDGSYFAYGADEVLIGEYSTQRAAMRAIPTRKNTEPRS
jgi:hypothetical protein